MAILSYVNLTTGYTDTSRPESVDAETIAVMAPWIDMALLPDDPLAAPPVPLPVPELAEFTAHIFTSAGGLAVTVYGPDILTVPPATPEPIPLATFAVARKGRHAVRLWEGLMGKAPVRQPPPMPAIPWCGVVLHPTLRFFPNATHWLAGFEQAVAWTWVLKER